MLTNQDFTKLNILKTHLYYDEPLTFNCEIKGKTYLAHFWAMTPEGGQYAFFLAEPDKLQALEADLVDMRSFFEDASKTQPAFIVTYNQGQVIKFEVKQWPELAKDCYVKSGIFLQSEERD